MGEEDKGRDLCERVSHGPLADDVQGHSETYGSGTPCVSSCGRWDALYLQGPEPQGGRVQRYSPRGALPNQRQLHALGGGEAAGGCHAAAAAAGGGRQGPV